jgi:hypothetical protein
LSALTNAEWLNYGLLKLKITGNNIYRALPQTAKGLFF